MPVKIKHAPKPKHPTTTDLRAFTNDTEYKRKYSAAAVQPVTANKQTLHVAAVLIFPRTVAPSVI
jgi:hypothetical protein